MGISKDIRVSIEGRRFPNDYSKEETKRIVKNLWKKHPKIGVM